MLSKHLIIFVKDVENKNIDIPLFLIVLNGVLLNKV